MFQLSVECPEEENKGQDDRQVFFGELEPHELLISLLVKRKKKKLIGGIKLFSFL